MQQQGVGQAAPLVAEKVAQVGGGVAQGLTAGGVALFGQPAGHQRRKLVLHHLVIMVGRLLHQRHRQQPRQRRLRCLQLQRQPRHPLHWHRRLVSGQAVEQGGGGGFKLRHHLGNCHIGLQFRLRLRQPRQKCVLSGHVHPGNGGSKKGKATAVAVQRVVYLPQPLPPLQKAKRQFAPRHLQKVAIAGAAQPPHIRFRPARQRPAGGEQQHQPLPRQPLRRPHPGGHGGVG